MQVGKTEEGCRGGVGWHGGGTLGEGRSQRGRSAAETVVCSTYGRSRMVLVLGRGDKHRTVRALDTEHEEMGCDEGEEEEDDDTGEMQLSTANVAMGWGVEVWSRR